MAEIGAYYVTILPSMNSFTSAMNRELGAAGTSGGKGWLNAFKASALGTAFGNMALRAGNALADGLDRGIQRLDTISNFPKVMENLGYTSEEAAASIKLITDHLDGLPTATDDMVRLTQAIADSTGDLDLATRAALGFNDMMLANGASTDEMTNATAILNRILGKQNATVAQWSSLQAVMPAQLNMVAEEMLGAGHSSEELRDALNNGTISWNDFLKAIVKLDEEGNGHVASFEEQARAMTGGIGTAIDNVSNRIAKGWEAILGAIGQENISGVINGFSETIRDGMKAVGDWILDLKERVEKSNIGENLKIIFERISDAAGNLRDAIGDTIPNVTQTLVDFIDGALQWMVDNGEQAATGIAAIAAAIAAFQAYEKVAGIISGISYAIDALSMVSLGGGLATTLGEVGTAFSLMAEEGGILTGVFGALGGGATGLGEILGGVALGPIAAVIAAIVGAIAVVKTLWDNNEWFRNAVMEIWESIKTKFEEAGQRLAEVGEVVSGAFGEVMTALEPVAQALGVLWNNVCNVIAPGIIIAIDTVANSFKGTVDIITGTIQAIVGLFQGFLTGDWSTFTEGLKTAWNGVWGVFTAPVKAVFDTVAGIFDDNSKKWEDWKKGVLDKNEELRKGALQKWEDIKKSFNQAVDDMVEKNSKDWKEFTDNLQSWNSDMQKAFTDQWNEMNDTLGENLNGMKAAAEETWNDISTRVGEIIDGIIGGVNEAKDTVINTFENLKNGVVEKIRWAEEQIGRIVDGIKNLFNFEWSLPAPKLPQINWHWEDLGGVVSLPVFDRISWAGKGGVFDTATIIGIGEKGKEAALPLNDATYREIARGIVAESKGMADGPSVLVTGNTWVIREEADIDRIADAINRKFIRERQAVA